MWVFRFLLVCAVLVSAKSWNFPLDSAGQHEIDLDLDPYYSAVDYILSLTDQAIPEVESSQEVSVYSYLFMNMHRPRFILMEASINPLPLSGALMRRSLPDAYDAVGINENLNLITALTTGFPEPWAMSYFIGNVVNFVRVDTARTVTGKGFGGALLSIGNYHIVNSLMVQDYWGEGELKLKGSDVRWTRRMSWSFRIGGKIHSHPDIFNVLYFAVKRDRVDLAERPTWNFLKLLITNSEIEFRADTRIPRDLRVWNYFTRFFLLAGKKWPSASGKYAFSLGLGLQLQFDKGYSGALAQELPNRMWGIILRPNVLF